MAGGRTFLLAALGAAVAAIAAGAYARELTWIADVWTQPTECPFNRAQPVAIDKIAADPNAFNGRCVLIRGVVSGTSLFPDRDSRIEQGALSGVIGIYGLDHLRVRLDGPVLVEAAGRIHRCKDFGRFHDTYCDTLDKDRVFLAASEVEVMDEPVTPQKRAAPPPPQK
jgi:hypothetical protein